MPTATFMEATATPLIVEAPTSTPTPEPLVPGELLYETDMRLGWEPIDEAYGTGSKNDRGYQLSVEFDQPWAIWAYTTKIRESDLFVEITATPDECPAGQGAYGVIFHFVSNAQFRFFVIACGGGFTLFERNGIDNATNLVSGTLPPGTNAAQGEHKIGVRVQAYTISLYFDGVELGRVEVADTPPGDVGPYVQTNSGRMAATFSHLAVFRP